MSKAGNAALKLMLSTGEYADVHFLVGDGDEKELLPAHKLVLKNASDVFEAMFRFDSQNGKSENASANCPVEVPDVEAAAFKVMLSFIYTEELSELNGHNAMEVLYAAKKYNIPDLVALSLQFSISELRNVFFAYAQARLFDLEDFAHRSLTYIDKNADTLLKSEEFLQIDQNLLCEILERDELQIHEEITIWNAALRWVDAKCRENGIECSAENRRKMLGPTLFRIRFPLFSQKEFSEKIVPSGILTADEVIGVEQCQCHPNFHGKSDGVLYPVQFPSRERTWVFGTLMMDIEKVSEFAREKVGSCRYSQNVRCIKGYSWQILAQINKKWRQGTDEQWLGFFVRCDSSKKDDLNWHCVCSATVRIMSQKNGTEHHVIGKFNDQGLNQKTNDWGFSHFIAFSELMDPEKGFYEESEDKVKLAIDFVVQDGKTEKLFFGPNKSSGTIEMEIEKVSKFAREIIGSDRKSETVYIKGFLWKIWARIEKNDESTEKWLGIYLLCDSPKEDKNWNCKCSTNYRIVSRKSGVRDYKIGGFTNEDTFNSESISWGFHDFISFAELMNPSKGFYNESNDKVTLAIDIIVK